MTHASRTTSRPESLRPVSAKDMRLAIGCTPAPIEQLEPWTAYEASQGHPLFGRYVYEDDGRPVAVLALYRYEIGGQRFLWAKHGPIWLKEQSPEREAHLRELLVREVRLKDSRVVFVRMHARYRAANTRELLSTITYDRTFVIDLRPRTPDAIAAAMPKDGRRGVKRADRVATEAGCVMAEETGLDRRAFDEVYQVMVTTAERDGFRPHPAEVYWDMLRTLGPEHARLFVLRRDGAPLGLGDVPASEGLALLDDALHALLDVAQELGGDGVDATEVVVEAVGDEGADAKVDVGEDLLDGLGHDVGDGVAQDVQAVLGAEGDGLHARARGNGPVQVPRLAIDPHGDDRAILSEERGPGGARLDAAHGAVEGDVDGGLGWHESAPGELWTGRCTGAPADGRESTRRPAPAQTPRRSRTRWRTRRARTRAA